MNVDNERRAGAARVPLHALVEIGAGQDGSAAFEAQAVDVSTAGMRLKTAYLPQEGETLVCRFEGAGAEVVVQGQVAWCTEDGYGGDFGIRFLKMDHESLEALRHIVGEIDAEEQDEPASGKTVPSGSRVRLHIEGLGAPMKARVRDGSSHEVMVGSNLEFLRVGRTVDLENVDGEANRPARIERISVEVDPSSHIPQLIVGLRFLDVAAAEADPTITCHAHDDVDEDLALNASPSNEPVGEAAYDTDDADDTGDVDDASDQYDNDEPVSARADAGVDDMDAGEGEDEEELSASEGFGAALWKRVKSVGPAFGALGSIAKAWSSKAANSVGDAVASAKTKAAEKGQQKKKPLRTTAPAPHGGVQLDQPYRRQRAHRSSQPMIEELDETRPAKGTRRVSKRTVIIAAAAAVLLVGGVAVAHTLATPSQPSAANEQTETDEAAALANINALDLPTAGGAMGQSPAATGAVGGAVGGNDLAAASPVPTANVPLLGPTAITTAALMVPMGAVAAPAVAAVTPPPGDGDQVAPSDDELEQQAVATTAASAGASDTNQLALAEDQDDSSDSDDVDDAPIVEKKSDKKTRKKARKSSSTKTDKATVKSFGKGKVSNPVVLTLRMKKPITDLRGVSKPDGFTVDVIGTRTAEGAAGFKKFDSRIASSGIVNKGGNAQFTMRFKSGVPNYRVQANGSSLRVLIDGAKRSTTASAASRGKRAH